MINLRNRPPKGRIKLKLGAGRKIVLEDVFDQFDLLLADPFKPLNYPVAIFWINLNTKRPQKDRRQTLFVLCGSQLASHRALEPSEWGEYAL